MASSYVTYTGTGSQTDFTIPFSYLATSDVFTFVNGVSVVFSWINSSAIRIASAPPAGTAIQIRRITQKTSVPVDFTDGSVLLEADLDALARYTLYQTQENFDASSMLPSPAPGNLIGWDTLGQNLVNVPSAAAVGASMVSLSTPAGASLIGYQPTGGTATVVQDKLRETVSVLDFGVVDLTGTASAQTVVAAAVAAAYSAGVPLYWPAGIYLTTASITNLRAVRHSGPGAVKRGTDIFYVQPTDAQSNTLYVSPTGAAANDGLSALQPINSMANLFAALKNYGPVLEGQWTAKLAASSSYDYGVTLTDLKSTKQIVIEGPNVGGHPNVPTAIVGPAGSTAGSGWRFTGVNVKIRNIRFINFRSSASAFALAVTEHGDLETDNVHVNNDTTASTRGGLGIAGNGLCILSVKGGIIERCAEGIRSLFGCYHAIGTQNAGNLLSGPVVRNNAVGFSAREASSGHSDWVTYEDNDFGISSEVNARVNCSYSDFKRNIVAIRVRDGNILRTACTYNLGGANANTEVIRAVASGTDLGADINSLSGRVRYRDAATSASLTGTTVETVLATYVLDAGDYMATSGSTYFGKCIRVKARGGLTGVVGTKTFRVRLGGLGGVNASGLIAVAASTGRWEFEVDIFVRGNSDQRINGKLITGGQSPILGAGSVAVNFATNLDVSLVVTGQLGAAADLISIDMFQVEVEG